MGSHVDKQKGFVSGLSMMHDLFISIVKANGHTVKIVSTSKYASSEGQIGNPALNRYVDYISIFWNLLCMFISNRKCIFYFNPSTAKMGFYRDVVAVYMAKFFGHKVLMQQFGAMFESFKKGLSKWEQKLLIRTYNKADLLIVEGENAKQQYSFLKNQNKIKIIQNGLPELNKNIEKSPKKLETNESFNLFFMNNMIESKGYVDVLKAVNILVNHKKKNVNCVFAGRFKQLQEDEYFKNIEEAREWFDRFIVDNNLSDRVKYYDCVFDKQKEIEFKKAHVFLLPSYYIFEGQPTAILEALSYGCVPIVTRYRLIPDMVNEECGLFVEPKSPDSIADAVMKLMEYPEQYEQMSRNAYDRFRENFTQEAYANRIMDVIQMM